MAVLFSGVVLCFGSDEQGYCVCRRDEQVRCIVTADVVHRLGLFAEVTDRSVCILCLQK